MNSQLSSNYLSLNERCTISIEVEAETKQSNMELYFSFDFGITFSLAINIFFAEIQV